METLEERLRRIVFDELDSRRRYDIDASYVDKKLDEVLRALVEMAFKEKNL